MAYITGYGTTKTIIKKIAKLCDLELWPNETSPFLTPENDFQVPAKMCVVTDNITHPKLQYLFNANIETLIDAGASATSIKDFVKSKNNRKYTGVFTALLTGPVVYQFDIARLITESLQGKLGFSGEQREDIVLAIHESLVNGLIHGNLSLSSELRQSASDFVSYAYLVDKRLTTPAFAKKAISINTYWNTKRLSITIKDEGMGYSLARVLDSSDNNSIEKSGRGLCLIASAADSCTIEDFGKQVTMSFLREKANKAVIKSSLLTAVNRKGNTDFTDSKVLIIENNQSTQALLAGLLNQLGVYRIKITSSAVDGLSQIPTFKPDLIILDIVLPHMDGHELITQLKTSADTKDIPILVQTASDTREARDTTFKAGASDFITKPINPLEFFARVRVHLKNAKLVKGLENKLSKINSELLSLKDMQQRLLPSKTDLTAVKNNYGLNIASYFKPSIQLGGDFWQVMPLDDNRIGVYLCDFSGHGLRSALNTFRLHTLIFRKHIDIDTPADFLKALNQQLFHLLDRGQFAAFFFAIIDVKNHTLSYSGAAAPVPFLKNKMGIQFLETTGLPLGISIDSNYENHQVPFKTGDKLLLYSDALTESVIQDSNLRLETAGFLNIAGDPLNNPNIEQGMKDIASSFFELIPPPVQDDITMVLIESTKATKK